MTDRSPDLGHERLKETCAFALPQETSVSTIDLTTSSNLLIGSMSPEDRALLAPHFVRVDLDRGEPLITAGRPIEHVWFPEGGIASVVAEAVTGTKTEVGIFGREGMSSIAVMLATDRMPMDTFIQVDGGMALRIHVDHLRAATTTSPSLRNLLLRFCHCFMIQISFSSVANAHHMIEGRLARWLLMCHDRVDGDEIALTHEFMAMMIAAQRTGVTIALHILEGAGMIRAKRGRVTIVDRELLMELAGDSYGASEAEYARLIAPLSK